MFLLAAIGQNHLNRVGYGFRDTGEKLPAVKYGCAVVGGADKYQYKNPRKGAGDFYINR